jgi:hypothetical protein
VNSYFRKTSQFNLIKISEECTTRIAGCVTSGMWVRWDPALGPLSDTGEHMFADDPSIET